jgi:hypothetical protein
LIWQVGILFIARKIAARLGDSLNQASESEDAPARENLSQESGASSP